MNPALLRQLLGGMELPHHDNTVRCSQCFHTLRDGAFITVVARRPCGVETWEVNAVYCPTHAPESVPETLNGRSALLDAEVGSLVNTVQQTHTPCLLGVYIRDVALDDDPDECAPIIEADESGGVAR